jgi:diadenosine tetraphosphate (Ap4A) HIT family hydrolase
LNKNGSALELESQEFPPSDREFLSLRSQQVSEAQKPCYICGRVQLWRKEQNPYFIYEFENSIFVLGEHQFHPGYSLILLKSHIRELHELPHSVQTALFHEVMTATKAIVRAFRPWKMNHSCYGNAEPHIHWHLFPRYDTRPDHTSNPWLHASEFKDHMIDLSEARRMIQRIQRSLEEVMNEGKGE